VVGGEGDVAKRGSALKKIQLYASGNLSKLAKAKKASETQKNCKEMPRD
jgi:hypothetical protein